jgi:hypothetical protein
VVELLTEHELPLPATGDNRASAIVSDAFFQSLMNAADDEALRRLVEERAALVQTAQAVGGIRRGRFGRPLSRDQSIFERRANGTPIGTAQDFAAAVRN